MSELKKPVLFSSRRPLDRAENIKAVFDAYQGEKVFVPMDPWRRNNALKCDLFDVLVADEVPGYFRGKTIYIGHGMSGGKLYGLDQLVPYMSQAQTQMLTYAVCTSENMIKLTAQQFRIPERKVLPLGMPRTDAYIGKKKGDGGTFLAKKRAYLWAPTYRTAEERPYMNINWAYIDDHLNDDEVFVVKDHMLADKYDLTGYKHIWKVSQDIPSTPYLIDCDVLITDYSSIMLDAHVLHKPVVLFAKDTTHYLTRRGMYLKYPDEYAGRFVNCEQLLIDVIQEAKKETKFDIECLRMTGSACDGHSTERVIQLIEELNNA